MHSRLSRLCDAIIEAGWLAALVVTPLFFNTFSSRVFEPDKIHLLRSIALIMAVAWIVQLLDGGVAGAGVRRQAGEATLWARLRATPLALPALLLVASYLISTALSVAPRISFLGSYVRMQGTFTFLSYATIFAMVLTHLRTPSQVNRLLHAIILTSLPIAIYAIIQNAGLDPLPWGGDVVTRAAANMGNAIFVAAYLIIAVFLTLERLLRSLARLLSAEKSSLGDSLSAGSYVFVLVVQVLAVVYTQSRGPWMGLAAGLYVFAMLGLLLLSRWAAGRGRAPTALAWLARNVKSVWLGFVALTVVAIGLVIALNVAPASFKGACEKRYVGRVCTMLSTTEGTNAVRVLIWEGVVDMMLKPHPAIEQPDGRPDPINALRPLVGYGPESMWVAYNRFYPPDLAHYEARNAAPDRSHNETFDALARGGFLQFGAEIFLFSSVFYYALRWLGLVQGRARRNLFLAMLTAGGVLGVIVPLLADGSLRLAGIGLPAGLISGVVVYVTVDLLLTGRREIGRPEAGPSAAGGRQVLILAVLAAIVAHFVEVHFGIAIVSTLTHFWTLAAVLVVVGMGWVGEVKEQGPALPAAAPAPVPAVSKTAAAKRKGGQPVRAAEERRARPRSSSQPVPEAAATPARSSLVALLPFAAVGGLVTLVLVWNYTVNQTGAQTPLAVLWDAFTARVDGYQILPSPMLLVMVLFTWIVGTLLSVVAAAEHQAGDGPQRRAAGAGIYAACVIATFLVFGAIHASRLLRADLAGIAFFRAMAGHIVVFDVFLLILIAALAAALVAADPRPIPARAFGTTPVLSIGAGAVLAVLAAIVIANFNVRTVQADTYYKQGLGYETAGQWEGAVVLYREAATLQPSEDYYYLFLGRALLQLSDTAEAGSAVLPDDLRDVPTGSLLTVVDRGVMSRSKEDLLRSAHAALIAARRLNPLNTDHTANLARLYRAWAFADTPAAGDTVNTSQLRAAIESSGSAVDAARLQQSEVYYEQALSLSPQNAGLWNELATVQLLRGNLKAAQASIESSLALDQRFYSTYLLQGDVLDAAGDKAGALAAFRNAAALAPSRDISALSAVGVFSAQMGDNEGSLAAFRRIAEIETAALTAAQKALVELDAQVARAGGYARAPASATSRQATLQAQIASHRSQVHLTYRNIALVLRDGGRTSEALEAAQQALNFAADDQRPAVEALIEDLKKKLGQ